MITDISTLYQQPHVVVFANKLYIRDSKTGAPGIYLLLDFIYSDNEINYSINHLMIYLKLKFNVGG